MRETLVGTRLIAAAAPDEDGLYHGTVFHHQSTFLYVFIPSKRLDIGPQWTYNRYMKTVEDLIPLTPAVFHILFTLATGEKHGYEIMKQVKQDTRGQIKMGNGTLYGSIKRMLADGLIEDAGDKLAADNERRKYYKLTEIGEKVLNAEMQRYVETVSLMQKRQLIPDMNVNFNL